MNEKELTKEIEKHNKLYWEKNEPEISDPDYDELKEALRKLNPNHPLLFAVEGLSAKGKRLVKQRMKMLSMNKVYSIEEVIEWCGEIARDENEEFLIGPKYDGLSSDYFNETLITKGDRDDEYGIDISNTKYLIELEVPIKRTFKESIENETCLDDFKGEVRGEILIKKSQFKWVQENIKKKDGSIYKNPRNAVAGIISRDDKIDTNEYLPLTLIDYKTIALIATLKELKETNGEKINAVQEYVQNEAFQYPVDGLVISLADEEYGKSLGTTTYSEKKHLALKFTNPSAKTILIDVILQCGKQVVTPIGIIKPVVISNCEINRVTLHNAKFIYDNDLHIGDNLIIEKAGDIIPHVKSSSPGESRIKANLEHCPICGGELGYQEPNLICYNEACDGSLIRKLEASVKCLNIEELGRPTIADMIAVLKIESIYDILILAEKDILKLPRFAEKSAKKLWDNIQKVITMPIPEYKLLSVLNIPGIGDTLSKQILDVYPLNKLSYDCDFSIIPNIGEEREELLYNGLYTNDDLLESLKQLLTIKKGVIKTKNKGSICFTGKLPKPESYYAKLAEEKGFTVKTSVNKDLTYLISEDPNSNSGKAQKAKELNIPIINTTNLMGLLKEGRK